MNFDDVILLRFGGEVSTKSRQTHKRLCRQIHHNVKALLERLAPGTKSELKGNRLFVYSGNEEVALGLSRIFGVLGVAQTKRMAWEEIADVVTAGVHLNKERVEGKTFAVRARRYGDRKVKGLRSVDFERAVGEALYPFAAGVDLKNAEAFVRLEISGDQVYFYVGDELNGPGGLPLRAEPARALTLISGGFDSPTASWRIMRRGVAQDYIFFNLAGPPQVRVVKSVVTELCARWSNGDEPTLTTVDLRPLVANLKETLPGKYWQVMLKRLMMRVADRWAQAHGHLALVTGEALGQVSTQVLATLAPIAASIETPVLRPLIGSNKSAIVEESKLVGTHDISAGVQEFCALEGGKPVTAIKTSVLNALEEKLNLALIDQLIELAETLPCTALATSEEAPELAVSALKDEHVILDLRDEPAYAAWHAPDSIHLPYGVAMENFPRLPKDRAYVLVCEVGLKSAFLAEHMHAAGFDAKNFDRGARALRKYVERRAKG